MTEPLLLRVLRGDAPPVPPIWMMRQAGRYLPEYRAVRAKAGTFLDLCYTPELAADVTLQPVERFDFDAAILFSDILVVPDALGRRVDFVEGRGPVLEPISLEALPDFNAEAVVERLAPVLQTVATVRARLSPEKALIGFCGGPWTVATYLIAGGGTPDQAPARLAALANPAAFGVLIQTLVEASARYLVAQLRAGADVVMIFDSWAGVLDAAGFERWAITPVRSIIDRVRGQVPEARIIGFPKGAGGRLGRYAAETGATGLSIDWTLPMGQARAMVGNTMALQGNLDPLRLIAGGTALDDGVDDIIEAMHGHPHIFNLGHGITPETPIAHVEQMVARVRRGRS